jgi:hypothetical protein
MHGTLHHRSGLRRALQMESYPKFHNEVWVPIVRIGCREFKCIGDKPHPNLRPSAFGFWRWTRTREALSASR